MTKKILISLTIIGVVAAIAVGGTIAFFSDTETSTGNTFTAGAIDLKIDNESYVTDEDGQLVRSPETSWELSDLPAEGVKLFFNFHDLKPGDLGEDTISLHVNSNDAWACMSIDITATPENDCTEPEDLEDDTCEGDVGELQDELYFAFWADDGDNVYEDNELIFKEGLAKDIFDGKRWALADSQHNVWGETGPIPGGMDSQPVYYIGKVWCYGNLEKTPQAQGNNDPLVATGFACDGEPVTNISQTDEVVADVEFYAEQARNNSNFLCDEPEIIQCTGWDCLSNLEKAIFTTGRYGNQNSLAQTWELAIWERSSGSEYVRADDGSDGSSYDWTSGTAEDFSLSYNPSNGNVSFTIGTKTINWTYSMSKKFTHIIPFVKGDGNDNNTQLTNVVVDGLSIPDLDSSTTYKGTIVPLTDAQQADGITVTGKVTLNWSSNPKNELPAFHIFTMGAH